MKLTIYEISNNNLCDISTTMLYIHLLKYSIWDVKLLRNNIE